MPPLYVRIRAMLRIIALIHLTLVCTLGGTLTATAQDVAITNARMVVGSGSVIDRGAIVVRGGRIVAVAAGAPAGGSGPTIDAKGMTALPGFIDAHRHIMTGNDER